MRVGFEAEPPATIAARPTPTPDPYQAAQLFLTCPAAVQRRGKDQAFVVRASAAIPSQTLPPPRNTRATKTAQLSTRSARSTLRGRGWVVPRDKPRGGRARDRPRLVGEAVDVERTCEKSPTPTPPPPPGRRSPPLLRRVAPRGARSAAASTCGSEVGRKLASLDALNRRGARAHRRGLGREARSRPRAACGRPVG